MNNEINKQYSEEINLLHWLNFILKIKWKLLLLFVIGGIAGVSLTFSLPKKNRGETIIKLGKLGNSSSGYIEKPSFVLFSGYIETPGEVSTKIKEGLYGHYDGIEVARIEDSDLLKIKIISTNSPSEIKNALSKMNEEILKEHNNILEKQKNALDKKITDIEKIITEQRAEGKETENLKIMLLDLNQEKENLMPTKVLLEPVVYEDKKSLVLYFLNFILGGILGFFLLLIYSSLWEWWRKNKAEIRI